MHLLTDKEYKPEYFSDVLKLDAQLDYSIGGQDLAEIFDRLVECACELLGCQAILISFDDIDTQFDTGWDVLEAIHVQDLYRQPIEIDIKNASFVI